MGLLKQVRDETPTAGAPSSIVMVRFSRTSHAYLGRGVTRNAWVVRLRGP